ncbi:hypothetical protein [Mycolicibacterium mageritense]|uniref:hypothetical protein n=1 Tax=Mycolicibacterium mageritense TaxID=53462 RepID=UPI001E48E17F|nr:hypothetical protein [Mycolicibacterium mageritense]GJJ19618.1 hypothetical protein MTY414_32910 [Mycolicibacterium mageritense]
MPAPVPPKRSNKWKWVLGALALLVVIGVTVAVTVTVLGRGDKEADGSPPSAAPVKDNGGNKSNSDIASANDTGPVAIITEDPTCAAQSPIFTTLAAQTKNGWEKRDPSIPAAEWTPEIRAQYETAGQAMRSAGDQLVPLAKLTPHRVMRELYEQYIAYSRAYVDRISNYTAVDDYLVSAANYTANSIGNICAAIEYKSAAARSPLVPPLPAASTVGRVDAVAAPHRFLGEPNQICGDWQGALSQADSDLSDWLSIPSDLPATEWSPEQRAINERAATIMSRLASQQQELGERSGNAILQDFASLAAQYRRGYVAALPTYTPADNYLATVGDKLGGTIKWACAAAG